MTTTLSYLPYDIIWQIGKYMDYDSSINFNRVLDPSDRLVHRKFSKQEMFEHEVIAQRRAIAIALSRVDVYSARSAKGLRKRCKCIVDMLSMMRTHKRASIIWKLYPKFYDSVMQKCKDIIDPDNWDFQRCTPYFKKWIQKTSNNLKTEMENKRPEKEPRVIVKEITI